MWYLLAFFTTWSCVLTVLHKYTHSIIELRFMTFMVMLMGLYLSFINPRRFVVHFHDGSVVTFTGAEKFVAVDMFLHIGVFVYISSLYSSKPFVLAKVVNTCILFIIYLSVTDVKRVYGVTLFEMTCVFLISYILFSLLLLK